MDSAPYSDNNRRPDLQERSESEHNLPINPRRKYRRRGTGDSVAYNGSAQEEDDRSTMSDSTDHELESLNSDTEFDEEVGISAEERRKFRQAQRRRNQFHTRASGVGIAKSENDITEADKYVINRLVVNTLLVASWYFFSLSISIYNTWMFSADNLNFHFPLFTTSIHMFVQFFLASMVLLVFPSLRPSQPQLEFSTVVKPLVTPAFYLSKLVPTGITTSLDIGLGNTSLRYISLTFYTMCKSSVLIFVLIFAFLFRLESPSWRLCLIILTMTLGVVMMVFGETAFHALGFVLAISASFFSGFRWALTQILLLRHPATSNPFATLFFLAPIMFVTLITISLISEKPSAIVTGLYMLSAHFGPLKAVLLMFVPGCLAFCMIASEFTLLQRTNVVTLSICGIFKEVVTISAAGIVFHDKLSLVNVSGLIVTIVAIACYNYMKITKMRQEAREKVARKEDRGNVVRSVEREVGAAHGDEASMPLMDDGPSRTMQPPR